MAHRIIKKLKPFKKKKNEDFLQQISYGAQSNKKKKKLLGKYKISYSAQSNQKSEAFLKCLEKI